MKPKPESYLEYHAKKFADHDRKRRYAIMSNNEKDAQKYLMNQLNDAWAIVNMILEDNQT